MRADRTEAAAERRKRRWAVWTAVLVLAAAVCACAVYVNDYYRTDAEAVAAFAPAEGISRRELADRTLVYAPEGAQAGFIFYPGGKVEYTAYVPLMEACAAEGILCALVEMPFNLAVFDVDAAEEIRQQFPEIKNWYIGGHSLGGSMAAAHLADHADEYEGLILLGSYSAEDLADSGLAVLSVYGSEDQVLNREKYAANRENLPEDFTEVVIEGGCHALFGMYGVQQGDGTPTISSEEQILLTAEAIADFVE